MTQKKYLVTARKYRPQTFEDVIGQDAVVTTLKNALKRGKAAHAYLFSGSRGVGKTSIARLFAKALNCIKKKDGVEPCNECPSCHEISQGQSLDVIEIDGASNRGIDDIRDITETACYSPSQGGFKIYIIDEVHMLTKEAFNALLKTLEEPPEKAKFLFATTEPQKVPATILSRCQRFDLKRIPIESITSKLAQIGKDQERIVHEEALHLIATYADGSLRDAESLFDQILCFAENEVSAESVRESLGLIPHSLFFTLDKAFSENNPSFAFDLIENLFSSGKDLFHFFTQLIEHIRLLSIAKLNPSTLPLPKELSKKYLESAALYHPSQCLYLLEYLLKVEPQIQKSSMPRASIEGALLHYIQSKNRIPVEILIQRLSEIEKNLIKLGVEPKPFFEQINSPPKEVEISIVKEPVIQIKEEKKAPAEEKKPVIDTPAFQPTFEALESKQKEEVPHDVLEKVPFNPFKPVPIEPIVEVEKIVEPALPPKEEPKSNTKIRNEVLMRFAAVELEGSLKIT